MKNALLILLLLSLTSAGQHIEKKPGRDRPTAFAILVDRQTFEGANESLQEYKAAIEADGLSAYLIADDWKRPEKVRETIAALYRRSPPLEGAALVGKIPICMVRDAQHLTSAFKMDQVKYPFPRSSVPSDRYYEDLDLSFRFLKQDEKNPLLFYYSLRAGSPQRIRKEIYTGRILPGDSATPGAVKAYFEKVVRRKKQQRPLRKAMVVTGHGYNSSSLISWEDQSHMLREQMPWLYRPGGGVWMYHHSESRDMKAAVLSRMQAPALNLLVFHAHGSPTTQYLLGSPRLPTIRSQVEAVKVFLRNKLRRAKKRKKDIDKEKAALIKRWGVPEAWFKGAFDAEVEAKDLARTAVEDIRIEDLKTVAPAPEIVVFDECFNGRFNADSCIAGAYVFGSGGCVAAVANTVNVLQDVWADEFLGLLGYGMRLGRCHLLRSHLESHIIGDPTFRFRPRPNIRPPAGKGRTWNLAACHRLVADTGAPATLRKLAVRILFQRREWAMEKTLMRLCREDPADIVRLEALKCLAAGRMPGLKDILLKTVEDPGEMVRRQTVRLMGEIGREDYPALLLQAAASDVSRRVVFQAHSALSRIAPTRIKTLLENGLPDLPDRSRKALLKRFGKRSAHLEGDLANLGDRTLDTIKRIRSIRTFRLYRLREAEPDLLAIAGNAKEATAVRVAALEALGWFSFSPLREDILEATEKIARSGEAPEPVRHEARKTRRRLKEGPNDPFTP